MREQLPQRRSAETASLQRDGIKFTLTTGRYPDGRVGEIFLSAEHGNSMLDAILNDCALDHIISPEVNS